MMTTLSLLKDKKWVRMDSDTYSRVNLLKICAHFSNNDSRDKIKNALAALERLKLLVVERTGWEKRHDYKI